MHDLKDDIKKIFINYKKKRIYKKGDYLTAVQNFTQAMLIQDFEKAKISNEEIYEIAKQVGINDNMDCVERLSFIKTGKLPLR